MKTHRVANLVFILILLSYCIYAGLFIYRTSFAVEGKTYFALFDDAMISMRYARNLAHGYGPVWNPGGERVEGYTNPLWVLFMAALHLLPVPARQVSLLVQVSAALLLVANLFFVKKVAELVSGKSAFVALASVFLTAFYLPLNTWSLQGMEVAALLPLTSLALWLALKSIDQGRFSPWPYILLGIGTLLRIDMVVPYLALLVYFLAIDRQNRGRNLAAGLGILCGFLALQTLFRIWYYGDPLPNTYYLKMTGYPTFLRLTRGLYVTLDFAWNLNWLLLLVPLGVALFWRDRRLLILPWLFLAQIAYSVYVGGDAWEWWGGANRYVCLGIPALFVFGACVMDHCLLRIPYRVVRGAWCVSSPHESSSGSSSPQPPNVAQRESLPEPGNPGHPSMRDTEHASRTTHCASRITFHASRLTFDIPRLTHCLLRIALVALALITLTNFDALYSRQSLAEWLLIRRPLHVTDNRKMVQSALILDRITTPEARVAVPFAGVLPYFLERETIDLLGKNDRHIARTPMRVASGYLKYISFYPGHMKWDYAYAIGQLKPDVITGLWYAPEEAEPYLKEYRQVEIGGFTFYLREGSDRIRWDSIQ